VDNIKIFIDHELVFNQALELWLELRKEINLNLLDGSNDLESNKNEVNKSFLERKIEDNNFYEIFELKFAEKCQSVFISNKFFLRLYLL